MYYALEHDYISDIRMKKIAEEERKDGRKEERNGELKPCFMRAQSNEFLPFFFERFLLQNKRASL